MTRVDGYFWLSYRRHVGTFTIPPCGCDLNGPDRMCDLGYALFKLATGLTRPS
jgi:hypothetical protein